MADAMGEFENQLGDLIEWLLIGVEIPIAAIIATFFIILIILLYIVLRKNGKADRPIVKGDLTLLEKGRLEIPGGMVTLDLQADRVVISLAGPEEEMVEEVPPEETAPEEGVGVIAPAKPEEEQEEQHEDTKQEKEVKEGSVPEKPKDEAPEKKTVISNLRLASDINTAVSIITHKHGLKSLTLANSEGLVVASTSGSPEEDAVEVASTITSAQSAPEKWVETQGGSRVTHRVHKEDTIYIHLRTGKAVPQGGLGPIMEDIKFSLDRTLA